MNMREQLARALLAEMQRQFPTITSSSEDGRVLEFLPCVDAILDAMCDVSDEVLLAGYIARFGKVEEGVEVVVIGVRYEWQTMIDAIKAGK